MPNPPSGTATPGRVRVRFAPSPTGFLHVGGARTALYNYLFARSHGGTFVLRIEDTDEARSTEECLGAILSSMRWLGLTWDEGPDVGGSYGPYFQSQRRELYREHADRLLAAGAAYPCFCTPQELEAKREAQRPAFRFRLDPAGQAEWNDIVRGPVTFQNAVLDDFVLLRSDGLPTYNFACVVDDAAMRITHVIRGDDHISNTPRQLLLYQAFGWPPPQLA